MMLNRMLKQTSNDWEKQAWRLQTFNTFRRITQPDRSQQILTSRIRLLMSSEMTLKLFQYLIHASAELCDFLFVFFEGRHGFGLDEFLV